MGDSFRQFIDDFFCPKDGGSGQPEPSDGGLPPGLDPFRGLRSVRTALRRHAPLAGAGSVRRSLSRPKPKEGGRAAIAGGGRRLA